ncbi:response regulator transcription factor [Burkholderia ubonensis]|uniref:LuxR family transcriptional regulator n=1 Tax=Burkholderia ubonensis TaxID=101571 RepID=A0AAW3MP68_9BURK|nr:response regulator transcription factor [Burkholderia ubonensis]KVK99000.1 LuxR family transcriptional regulator [Burkholderia ubonensis]KVN74689.1 LuxR family transcriptional regulator [Burkholderia ubonensis]KVO39567.1 LuxR family transcriptional regulator [Burkholderia ubonensis]KVP89332.1 LuxR family transcriptional regulator [Burkholderia ubonensis]KVQ54196.1 LuxR family transcriptional regulator [Burkholderia ubonensis]
MASLNIRVIVADNHPIILAGLSHVLNAGSSINVVGAYQNSAELLAALGEHPCDVIISDYIMPGGNYSDGISLFSYIRRRYPNVRLIALTVISNPTIVRNLMSQGISAVLSKSDGIAHIVAAIHASYARRVYLSPTIKAMVNGEGGTRADGDVALSRRETEVVRLFTSGLSISEIADRLKRSKQTISSQKSTAMRKLGLNRDIDLLQYALRAKLLVDAPSP